MSDYRPPSKDAPVNLVLPAPQLPPIQKQPSVDPRRLEIELLDVSVKGLPTYAQALSVGIARHQGRLGRGVELPHPIKAVGSSHLFRLCDEPRKLGGTKTKTAEASERP